MRKRVFLLAALASCLCSFAAAQGDAKGGTIDFSELKPSGIVIPVFSEIIALPHPDGFVGAFEHTNEHPDGAYYIHEMVLKGETVDQWSQMITATGKQGLSSSANLTPKIYLERLAAGFQRHCPDTFSVKGIGSTTVSGHEAFVAWASCGTVDPGAKAHSESALLIAIKGTQDYYTIQWAERGPASSQPIVYDDARWGARLKKLSSVRTCPRIPGEAAPYPSCVDEK
jgi:hypothetical protein